MNGFQQRTEHSRAAQLGASLKHLATILEELDSRFVELAKVTQIIDERTVQLGTGTAEAYNALAATVGQLQDTGTERWLANGTAQKRLFDRWAAFDALTFWQRLRWIVTGRC